MPHFVLDCSVDILEILSEEEIMEQIHLVADSTQLFNPNDIKVRISPFKKFSVGNKKESFIHVFANIMEGRRTVQKANLSRLIVQKLVLLFPDVPNIAINIREFEKATYCNKAMI